MNNNILVSTIIWVLWGGLSFAQQPSRIELLGVVSIPGESRDLSNFTNVLSGDLPHNRFGGISGIDYDPKSDTYWALSDRGPNDGAEKWTCRVHQMALELPANLHESRVSWRILKTVILKDANQTAFTGQAAAIQNVSIGPTRLDPEGIRIRNNQLLISDEYGPYLKAFDLDGHFINDVSVPEPFSVVTPNADEVIENQSNTTGRQANRGMEGLGIGPDQRLFGLMQSPLLQDCCRLDTGRLEGLNCRLVTYDPNDRVQSQVVYPLSENSNKLNEILAINEHEFLVIERDGKAGGEAAKKWITRIDVKDATDVSAMNALPSGQLPESIKPVRKSLFIDLLDPQFGLASESFPEKVEGLCWGPTQKDGRRTLIVAVDNDFKKENPTLIYVFAVRLEQANPKSN